MVWIAIFSLIFFLFLFAKGLFTGQTLLVSRSNGTFSRVDKKTDPILFYVYMAIYFFICIALAYSVSTFK